MLPYRPYAAAATLVIFYGGNWVSYLQYIAVGVLIVVNVVAVAYLSIGNRREFQSMMHMMYER